jgi:hypothetical protein
MSQTVKSAVPSHLKPALGGGGGGGNGDSEAQFERRHGKTRSHMVSEFPFSFALLSPVNWCWLVSPESSCRGLRGLDAAVLLGQPAVTFARNAEPDSKF